jgi:hypothetical protein
LNSRSDRPQPPQASFGSDAGRILNFINGSVLYAFTIDPAVPGAGCTVSTILAEAFPTEVQSLYKQYAEACALGQNFVNLTLVSALAE